MDYRVVYTKTAEKDLSRLEKKVAVRILKKIESYAKNNGSAHVRKEAYK